MHLRVTLKCIRNLPVPHTNIIVLSSTQYNVNKWLMFAMLPQEVLFFEKNVYLLPENSKN